MKLFCLIFFLLAAYLQAKKGESQFSPNLDILPSGATLRNVTIPRYDANGYPFAMLQAARLKVLNKEELTGEEVILTVIGKKGETKLKVTMDAATYNVTQSMVEAEGRLVASNNRFYGEGLGGIFQLEQRRGFVYGPVDCYLLPEPKKHSYLKKRHLLPAPLLLFSALAEDIVLPLPKELPKAERLTLEMQAQPIDYLYRLSTEESKREIVEINDLSLNLNESLQSFAYDVRRPALANHLIQAKDEPPARELPNFGPGTTKVSCQGGWYFDGEKGHLVFLEKVRLTDDRFSLKCEKELKVFFDPVEDEKKKKPEDEQKIAIGEVDSVLATGDVEFRGKTEKGEEFIARGSLASYNLKKNEVIIQGGQPYLQYGEKFATHSENKDAFIRAILLPNGHLKAIPSGTGWVTIFNIGERDK